MIIYHLPPIDQWSGWQCPDKVFIGTEEDVDAHQSADWGELWTSVQKLALQMGWEGDVRDGPYVTVLPREPLDYWPGHVIIAWKQDNNGDTFLASPIHLPWLETEYAEWRKF